jgi:hypothetical protein
VIATSVGMLRGFDTRAVAEFWAAVLGYEVVPSDARLLCTGRGARPLLQADAEVADDRASHPPRRQRARPGGRGEPNIGLGAKLVETKTSEAGELKENFTVLRDPMETRSASSDQRGSRPDSVLRPAPWADHRLSLEHVVHFQATG